MEGSDKTRIVLLGKTGSGKSSLGNTILGDSLRVKSSPNSETSECQAKTKNINGKLITVVDIPGLFDTNMDEKQLKPEIIKSVKECSHGVHAFIIVMEVERYTEQEKDVIRKILKYFSEEALKHAVVVFTHGDQLNEGQTIETFYSQNADLSNLVEKCGGRCHVVDNKYWNNTQHYEYRSNEFQVKEILNTVEKMKNNQGIYTNEFLQKAGKMSDDELWTMFVGVSAGLGITVLLGSGVGLAIGAIGGVGLAISAGIGAIASVAPGCVAGAAIGNSEKAQKTFKDLKSKIGKPKHQ